MKNTKISKELQKILDNTPTTEEVLKEIDKLEFPDLENDPEFVSDYLKGQITEDILAAMEENGMNKNQLARKLGNSRQYVNRILNETANFTLDTLAKFACALDCKIEARIVNKNKYLISSSAYKKESESELECVIQKMPTNNQNANRNIEPGAKNEKFALVS
ncbi:helix-turn-helix transcriptional regulator [bacterium]|nr:helix-turn-helix transcriptional regulator [bacterium]